MIPIQLTLQGLYSYQAKQTIDFTRLTGAGLFGIFGTVGSGKSSILEAITFALYGRTDRLNLSGDNRNYNMMNLKSRELLIDFIFETGREQTAYRSTVRGRRNSKRFEEVKTLDRAAYKKVNNEWLPIEQEVLVEAIGLSYENFKRTIIIPQGQFQEFLQLGNKDRTQMLKELFNLEKYEFFYKVVSLESKNNAQMQHLGGQLQQLGEIDPEQVYLCQSQLKELEEAIGAQNRMLNEHQQKEEQLRALQELTHKRSEAEKEVRELKEQEPDYRALEKRIGRYEQCLYLFKHQLDLLKERGRKKEERAAQIESDKKKLKEEEAEIERIEKRVGEIKPAYEKRDELQKKAAELALLLRMKTVEESIAKEEIRLKSGVDYLDQATRQAEKLKTGKQQLEGLIRELRNNAPDLTLLSAIRSWHSENKNLGQLLRDSVIEIEKYAQQEKALLEEKSLLLSDPLFEKLSHDAGYSDCERCLDQVTDKVKEQQCKLGEEENHFLVKERLKSYARELKEGKPCPLCGSTHHPELYQSDELRKQLQQIGEEKQALEQQLNHIALLSRKLSLLQSRQQQIRLSQTEWSEKSSMLRQKITDHARQFIWEKYRDEEQLNAAFLQAKEIQEALTEHEKALSKVTSQLEQEEINRERYRSELEKIRTALTVHETTLTTLGQQLMLITPEQYRQTGVT
ncbi:MAG: AAA family ATPase, partial [Proteiniphilum sp.]|nr:AAA family ATPase [Proteiniphilum sp.]